MKTFQRQHRPRVRGAIPATDGNCIWLPSDTGLTEAAQALERFRTVARQQAMREVRGSAAGAGRCATPLVRDLYLLIEAHAADAALAQLLPGTQGPLDVLRAAALRARPALTSFPAGRQALEAWVRRLMAPPSLVRGADTLCSPSPERSRPMARDVANELQADDSMAGRLGTQPLFKDWWTGDFSVPRPQPASRARSARLARRPEVRNATNEEDDARQGAWMIQASAPHEVAEDRFGLQRPTDGDAQTAVDEFAESRAELEQARLVSIPGGPKEVLLSDDPDARAQPGDVVGADGSGQVRYPEWHPRIQAYREPGAAVRHASATLMREPALQRLQILLSDGKPNDVDVYEGRYGVEDLRRAVIEAKLQGIAPFCLTVGRNAASYLPDVFGANQYALLAKPSMLPAVLLDWMHRLVMAA